MKLAVLTLLAVTTLLASGCGDTGERVPVDRVPADRAPAADDQPTDDPPTDGPEAPEAPES